jgi:catalase
MPESTHMLMLAMSDRAIPRSLRMIEGFGIHTFRLVNAKGKSKFVRFHWNPKLGLQSTLWGRGAQAATTTTIAAISGKPSIAATP